MLKEKVGLASPPVTPQLERKYEKAREEKHRERYGQDYSLSTNNHFEDRHTGKMAPEFAEFCLNPEQSRTYYHRKTEKQTWYDLCLLDDDEEDTEIESNKIYLSLDDYEQLEYTVKGVEKRSTTLTAKPPLTINQCIALKSQILQIVINAGHIDPLEDIYYEDIPTLNIPPCGKNQKPSIIVPEGSVAKAFIRGKAVFLRPGPYALSPDIELTTSPLIEVNSKHIVHGVWNIITIKNQELWQVTDPLKNDDFRVLTQGRHVFKLASGRAREIKDTTEKVLWVEWDTKETEPKPAPTPKAELKSEASTEVRAEAKPAPKIPAGFKPGRVLFVKIPQGKVGVAYDNQGQLRIFDPGMIYLPPSWIFYDFISSKRNIETIVMNEIRTKDGIFVDVIVKVEYLIPSPYLTVREFGPNNKDKAIIEATSSEARILVNKTEYIAKTMLDLSGAPPSIFKTEAPMPEGPELPPDYEENQVVIDRLNKQLEASQVAITKVSMVSMQASSSVVELAIQEAVAMRVREMSAQKTAQELPTLRLALEALKLSIEIQKLQLQLHEAELFSAQQRIEFIEKNKPTVQQALEKAKALSGTLGATEIYIEDSKTQRKMMKEQRKLMTQTRGMFFNKQNGVPLSDALPLARDASPAVPVEVHVDESVRLDGV